MFTFCERDGILKVEKTFLCAGRLADAAAVTNIGGGDAQRYEKMLFVQTNFVYREDFLQASHEFDNASTNTKCNLQERRLTRRRTWIPACADRQYGRQGDWYEKIVRDFYSCAVLRAGGMQPGLGGIQRELRQQSRGYPHTAE